MKDIHEIFCTENTNPNFGIIYAKREKDFLKQYFIEVYDYEDEGFNAALRYSQTSFDEVGFLIEGSSYLFSDGLFSFYHEDIDQNFESEKKSRNQFSKEGLENTLVFLKSDFAPLFNIHENLLQYKPLFKELFYNL